MHPWCTVVASFVCGRSPWPMPTLLDVLGWCPSGWGSLPTGWGSLLACRVLPACRMMIGPCPPTVWLGLSAHRMIGYAGTTFPFTVRVNIIDVPLAPLGLYVNVLSQGCPLDESLLLSRSVSMYISATWVCLYPGISPLRKKKALNSHRIVHNVQILS